MNRVNQSPVIVSPTSEKQPVTGSEILIRSLLAEGVETIFGYPGGVTPVYRTR